MLKFSDLAEIMDGQILHLSGDQRISRILTDSRQLVVHPEAVFFAIQGVNHDGHQFLEEVFNRGIRNFVVQKPVTGMLSRANVIAVPNTVRALQAMAAYHRSQFDIPVLGITGSNAKTIIKEWLFQLMEDRKVIKSPKSYNSQIGVPLSVWQLDASAEMAIFEAGISQKGEMEHIASIVRPSIGIFTNIGPAHDAGFRDLEEKIREKALLFRECSTLIYRQDHPLIHKILKKEFPNSVRFGWSTKKSNEHYFKLIPEGSGTRCQWNFKEGGSVLVPFSDDASVENALHCITFLVLQGYHSDTINDRIQALTNIPHRLALKKGINNCYLVDDTYNNDLAGLSVALDFLNQQPHGKEKVLILSDIYQSSGTTHDLYNSVSERIKSYGINRFYGIGSDLARHRELFPEGSMFCQSTNEFLNKVDPGNFENQVLLIKGARDFAFERIVQALIKKHHGTVLEINLDALSHNLNYFKSLLATDTKIMVMVKAFAYGTGSHEVANLLQYHGVDYLGVAYADEGTDLRKQGIHIPIMVMNPSPEDFDQMLEHHLEPEIYCLELLRTFQAYCKSNNTALKIHLKLDTGMRRLGFEISELEEVAEILNEYPLPIASVFSHLAAADNPEEMDFSRQQFESFQQGTEQLNSLTNCTFIRHIVNSAGIVAFPKFHLDMVRLGIGLYGIGLVEQLLSISSLKTTISQIKFVPKGETIGYDRSGKVNRDSKIATIAIGYADGYDRRFGNGVGKILVGNKLAPVVGNICMDMTMIDVTDCKAAVGDRVIVFNDKLSIQELANAIGTIPYELLTKVSERVKRVYYLE
jgi:alanine racemase